MTRANSFLESLSTAIRDAGAGDIGPSRLANISLGEILKYAERFNISLSVGEAQPSLTDDDVLALACKHFGRPGEVVVLQIHHLGDRTVSPSMEELEAQLDSICDGCNPLEGLESDIRAGRKTNQEVLNFFKNEPRLKKVFGMLELVVNSPMFSGRTLEIIKKEPKAMKAIGVLLKDYEILRRIGVPEIPFMETLKRSVA